MSFSPRLFGPWRRNLQLTIAALFVIMPFVKLRGQSAMRLDIPNLTLYLGGLGFRVEELYIVCIFIFWLIFLFLLLTLVLGRVWCGWICPQTLFSDLADFMGSKLSPKKTTLPTVAIKHLIYLVVSAITGSTVVCYFLEPNVFWHRLWQGNPGAWSTGTALATTLIIYLDLAFIRRLFCRDFCPYGRFQTVLVDQGTLTLHAHPDHLPRCFDCKSCVRVCPTGIDIRDGYQIECINCARCLDACRKVMALKDKQGIIQYTFGLQDKGIKSLLNIKTTSVMLIVLGLFITLAYTTSHRPRASLKIGRSAIKSRITNVMQITFYQGFITNFRNYDITLRLKAKNDTGAQVKIKGPSTFTLLGREKRNINFAVLTPQKTDDIPIPLLFVLEDAQGKTIQTIKGFY